MTIITLLFKLSIVGSLVLSGCLFSSWLSFSFLRQKTLRLARVCPAKRWSIIWGIWVVFFMLCLGMGFYFQSVFFMVFSMGLLGALMVWIYFFDREDGLVFWGYFVGSVFVAALFSMILYWRTGTYFLSGGDDRYFFYVSQYVAEYLFSLETLPLFLGGHPGYIYFLASIVRFGFWLQEFNFFVYYVSFHLINVSFASILLIYLRRVCKCLKLDDRVRDVATWLYVLSPFIVFYYSVFLRDIIVGCLMMGCVYHYISFRQRRSFLSLMAFFGVWLALILFRTQSGFLVFFVLLAGDFLMMIFTKWSRLKVPFFWIMLGMVPLSLYLLTHISSITLFDRTLYFERMLVDRVAFNVAQASESGFGAMLLKLPLLIRLIPSFLYYLLAPIPPFSFDSMIASSYSPEDFLPGIFAIFGYSILPFFVLGVYKTFKDSDVRFLKILGVLVLVFILLIALTSGDPRHRTNIIAPMYLLTAYGVVLYKDEFELLRHSFVFFLAKCLAIVPLFLYLGLRIWVAF